MSMERKWRLVKSRDGLADYYNLICILCLLAGLAGTYAVNQPASAPPLGAALGRAVIRVAP